MAAAVGRRRPRWPARVGFVRIAAAAGGIIGRRRSLRPSVDEYLEESSVDASRIGDVLGFHPQFDLAAGFRMTAETLRATGELPPMAGPALARS